MIISGSDLTLGARLRAGLVVIGAGPAGIVCALEASKKGVDVILIETGNRRQRPDYQNLSVAYRQCPDVHAPVELTLSRQLGGTSSIWGGRCVPYDHVDFVERDCAPGSVWPVKYEELQCYFKPACEWMVCGRPAFDVHELDHLPRRMIPGLDDGAVRTSSLKRWSLPTDFGRVYFDDLTDTRNLRVITDATCVRINLDGGPSPGDRSQLQDYVGGVVHSRSP